MMVMMVMMMMMMMMTMTVAIVCVVHILHQSQEAWLKVSWSSPASCVLCTLQFSISQNAGILIRQTWVVSRRRLLLQLGSSKEWTWKMGPSNSSYIPSLKLTAPKNGGFQSRNLLDSRGKPPFSERFPVSFRVLLLHFKKKRRFTNFQNSKRSNPNPSNESKVQNQSITNTPWICLDVPLLNELQNLAV